MIDPAIAAAYQAFGSDDPLDPLVDVLTAYHAVRPLTAAEIRLVPELAAARMAQSLLISAWRSELHPDNLDYILADAEDCFATLTRLDEHDPAALADALAEACGVLRRPHPSLDESLALRRARLGPALSLSYDEPCASSRATASGSPTSTATGCSTPTTTCRRSGTPTPA